MARDLETILDSGVDLEKRLVFLFGPIDSQKAFDVIAGLHFLRDHTNDEVRLLICSEGGEEAAGWAIVDALLAMKNVSAIGTGEISSIASIIFVAANNRYMTPNCRLMIHNGTTEMNGDVDTDRLIRRAKDIEHMNLKYAGFLAERSGVLSLADVHDMCQQETFLDAADAIAYGFAHKVI
jgi:ATP-dependent Clp endopeptidase proteolytic subunit ClpP